MHPTPPVASQLAPRAVPIPDLRATCLSGTVVDTTGAGDAFNGALAAGVAEGRRLREAVDRAQVAGALAVGRAGAREGMPTVAEVARATAGRAQDIPTAPAGAA